MTATAIAFDAFGARVTAFRLSHRDDEAVDIVVGPANSNSRDQDWTYFGAVVGRVAGRIARARFDLDGVAYELGANDGCNLLHGGQNGFSSQNWARDPLGDDAAAQIRFTLQSGDLDQGFPGEVEVSAHYSWEADNWLELDIRASVSKPTPLNLTQHIYWNLGGPGSETIHDHVLQVQAERFLPLHADLLPNGELRSVEQTHFDFRSPRRIGTALGCCDPQIAIAQGIDHCWVLNGAGFREVAILSDPHSGRRMAVWTDQPGLQIYTANHLGAGPAGKGGKPYRQHAGIAFETQGFPDAPNHPHFPGIIVRPGELYRNRTRFVFTNESQSHLVRG